VSGPATPAETARVLRTYLRGDRLVQMPRAGLRRQIVLEQIVQRFEPGQRYVEDEVNLILDPVWDDVAALRRHLVDAALLARESGEYWRIGGPVDVT
jgi:hypothetical protein